MASLVSDFLINPVLRQARRISEISRPITGQVASDVEQPHKTVAHAPDESILLNQIGLFNTTDSLIRPLAPGTAPPSNSAILSVASPQSDSFTLEETTISGQPDITVVQRYPRTRYEEDSDSDSDESLECPSPMMLEPHDTPGSGAEDREQELPEDDGMAEMRSQIRLIHKMKAPQADKGRLLHGVLVKGHLAVKGVRKTAREVDGPSEPEGPMVQKRLAVGSSSAMLNNPLSGLKFWNSEENATPESEEIFNLSERDLQPSFHPTDHQLGCRHYHRNVKLQCATCDKWYPCRLCHDHAEDHELPRRETKNMLCMLCFCPQRVSDSCVNCEVSAALYYCNVCKLWENRPNRPIYHCHDCGICRKGHGLGEDFFHCKTCNACISTTIKSSHKCIERSTDCNCPICEDYLFTSRKSVVFMGCGHSIHRSCHEKYLANGCYKCPLCNKAILNTETLFRTMDMAIEQQPMPEEFSDTKAVTLCHECLTRTTVPYHWLGLKCGLCDSYNTALIETIDHPSAHDTESTDGSEADMGQGSSTVTPANVALRHDQIMFPHAGGGALQHLGAQEATRQAQMYGEINSGVNDDVIVGSLDSVRDSNLSDARPPNQRTISRPPIQELDAESVERFLQQFDHEATQDIMNIWNGSIDGEGVGALARNALSSLQQALHSDILEGEDPTGVAALTRNVFNTLQQALHGNSETDGENNINLSWNALAYLHQAIHGNVVDSGDEGDDADDEDADYGDEGEFSDDQSSIAGDFDEVEDDIVLFGHR